MKKVLYQGAEAKIFLNEKEGLVIKDRIPKSYRIKELDDKIRKQRTKAEKKLLEKASKIINAPNPLPLKELNIIQMPYIEGKKLSEHLDNFPLEKQKGIMKTIGEETAKLHDNDIIHGDLTTSNLILVDVSATQNELNDNKESSVNNKQCQKVLSTLNIPKRSRATSRVSDNPIRVGLGVMMKSDVKQLISNNPKIFFIDFGLGFISKKIEDKAVDVHLLKQALEAKHFTHWEVLFDEFLKGYSNSKEAKQTLERLKAVEKRGRYKH